MNTSTNAFINMGNFVQAGRAMTAIDGLAQLTRLGDRHLTLLMDVSTRPFDYRGAPPFALCVINDSFAKELLRLHCLCVDNGVNEVRLACSPEWAKFPDDNQAMDIPNCSHLCVSSTGSFCFFDETDSGEMVLTEWVDFSELAASVAAAEGVALICTGMGARHFEDFIGTAENER